MAGYDFRTNPEETDALSFYVFDNLNARGGENGGNIYRFDTAQEALEAFRSIGEEHPDWLVALGGSIDGVHEVDFVHRLESGELALLTDFKLIDFWVERPDVERAVEEIQAALDADGMGERALGVDLPDTGKPFFDYRTSYGETEHVNLTLATYADNDNLYVGLDFFDPDIGGMDFYGDVTSNVIKLPPFMACIDTNNNNAEKIMAFLKENGFGEPTGGALPSGFCMYPLFCFNPEKLCEADPVGFAQHCRDAGIKLEMPEAAQDSLDEAKKQARERAREHNAERPERPQRSRDLEL